MKNQRLKIVVVATAVVVGILFVVALALDSPGAVAQDAPALWLSSAEPPPGTSAEALSAPDQPGLPANRSDEAPQSPEEPSAVISYRIAGSALRPRDSIVNFDNNVTGGCIFAEDNALDVFNTPIWLPQGTEVSTIRMYYNDTSASNSTAWFTVYDLYGTIVDEWSVSSTGNAGNGFNDSASFLHTVDYATYSYLLNWRPVVAGTAMQLCGFRIFHEPPFGLQFLPTIVRE